MTQKKVIYINAPNIRHGGGLMLLETILESINSLNFSAKGNLNPTLESNPNIDQIHRKGFEFSESGFSNYIFPYLRNNDLLKDPEQIVLFFGNLPPVIKVKGISFLYIHSKLILEPTFKYKLTLATRLKLIFEKFFIFIFYKNVDYIVVQTPSMYQLSSQILKKRPTIEIPFFDFNYQNKQSNYKIKYDFFYPSYGYTYKNHKNLIKGLVLLSQKGIFPNLVIALDSKIDTELIEYINDKIYLHKLNVHLILDESSEQMNDYYLSCKALVWPSLTESFGIPLIEASRHQKDILASDLDYIHDILEIKKEYCFDPNNPLSIAECLNNYLSQYENKEINHKVKIKIYSGKEFIKKLFLVVSRRTI